MNKQELLFMHRELPVHPPVGALVESGKIDCSLVIWYISKTVKLKTSQESSYVKKIIDIIVAKLVTDFIFLLVFSNRYNTNTYTLIYSFN